MDLEEASTAGVETVVPASPATATLVHTALCSALLVTVEPTWVHPAGVLGFAGVVDDP